MHECKEKKQKKKEKTLETGVKNWCKRAVSPFRAASESKAKVVWPNSDTHSESHSPEPGGEPSVTHSVLQYVYSVEVCH